MKTDTVFIDVDDLHCEKQIIDLLVPVYEALASGPIEEDPKALRGRPMITAYTIPNRMGSVKTLTRMFPWLVFGIHGFEHTMCECLCWTKPMAVAFMKRALEMGYAKVFKPPNWECHTEIEEACLELGLILHHHETYRPTVQGLCCYPGPPAIRTGLRHKNIHTHIVKNPVTDYIDGHPDFRPEKLKKWVHAVDISKVAVVIP